MTTSTLAPLALSATLLTAGTAGAGPIRHRANHQQARSHRGVENGSLTPGERRALNAEQAAIRAARRDAVADDGHVGPREAAALHRARDRASHHIDRLKHNDREVAR